MEDRDAMNPKKILILCKKVPFPPTDGEGIVIMSDISALRAVGMEVHVFCLNTVKHSIDTSSYPQLPYWESFSDMTLDTNRYCSSLISSIFHSSPFHIERFYSAEAQKIVNRLIHSIGIDTILCQGLAMTLYTKNLKSDVRICYRMHNIESTIWNQLAYSTSSFLKQIIYKSISKSLEIFEKNISNSIKIIALSQSESDQLKKYFHLDSVPLAISLGEDASGSYEPKATGILFVGSLDWRPNQEGLDWFIKEIYPEISDIPLTIAGKGSYWENNLPEGVKILENFKSIESLFSSHRLMIIPLLSGAGIRVKIIEGIRFGIPIVSTSIGAEGLFEDSTILRIENHPGLFADAIRSLYYEEDSLSELSQKERLHYQMNYSEAKIQEGWISILNSL